MLTNRVANSNLTINQTSTPKTTERSVGSLNNYGSSKNTPFSITEGQVIKGEVTDLRNNEVSVTLENNVKVTGTLENGTTLSIGQPAAFKVIGVSSQGITLEALPNNYSQSESITITKALEEAGLPKTDRNQAIVHELLQNQMSINKQSIQLLIQQSLNFKGASIGTLVLMNKLNIPITQENAAQFEKYRNYEHRLIKEIDTISDSLPSLLEKLSNHNSPEQVSAFSGKLFSFLLSQGETPSTSNELLNPNVVLNSPEDRQELISTLENFSLTPQMKEQLLYGTVPLRDLMKTIQSSMEMATQIDAKNIENALLENQEDISSPVSDAKDSTISNDTLLSEKLMDIPRTMEAFESPIIRAIFEHYETMQRDNCELGGFLSPSQRENLASYLKDFPQSPQLKERISNGTATAREILTVIKNVLPLTKPDAVRDLFRTAEFKMLLKEELLSNWTITPHALQKEKAVDELYSKMYTQLSQIDDLIQSSLTGSESSSLSNHASQMRENIDFMKTLNEMFTYVQLPLKLKHSNVHSDLYVYTNKKDLRNHPQNISVLLHLDMDHLGPLDIHITLMNHHISSKFYISDDDSQELIQNNVSMLTEALHHKGYTFSAEMKKREQDIDIVNDFIEKDMPSTSLKRYTFDIRA